MSLRILSAANVEHLVANLVPLSELLSHTARLFHQLSHDPLSISNPLRSSVEMQGYTLLSMPAYVSGIGTSVKVVAVPKRTISNANSNPGSEEVEEGVHHERRRPGLSATTIVLDSLSGVPKCIMNARHLTALRTAAGSLLATKLLLDSKSKPDPVTLVLFGAGLQIQYHAELILSAFPSIESCYLLTRSPNARANGLYSRLVQAHPAKRVRLITRANDHQEFSVEVSNSNSPEQDQHEHEHHLDLDHHRDRYPRSWRQATLAADILVFATPSTTPLVQSSWVKPGAHVVLVGSYTPAMHEVPTDLVKRASRVVVDARDHCMREAGELITAKLDPERDVLELGELLGAGTLGVPVTERIQSAQMGDITIFKSVGLAIQDVMISQLLSDAADASAIGTVVADFD